jgi:putative effector of murein hydrolase LrgA (UPF0299 family)
MNTNAPTSTPQRGFGGWKSILALGLTHIPALLRLGYVYKAGISEYRAFFVALMLLASLVVLFVPTAIGLARARTRAARAFTLIGVLHVLGMNTIYTIWAWSINGPAWHYSK